MGERSLQNIIDEGREKKAAERLAKTVFSKGARGSPAPKASPAGSLAARASRNGISKPQVQAKKELFPQQMTRKHQLFSDVSQGSAPEPVNSQVNIVKPSHRSFSIRGFAASKAYVVTASNFARNTLPIDIEAAFETVGGRARACKVISTDPTVSVELSYDEKDAADKIVANFHGIEADGNILSVYVRQDAPVAELHPLQTAASIQSSSPAMVPIDAVQTVEPTRDSQSLYETHPSQIASMDVDFDQPQAAPPTQPHADYRGESGNSRDNGYESSNSYNRGSGYNRSYAQGGYPRGNYRSNSRYPSLRDRYEQANGRRDDRGSYYRPG